MAVAKREEAAITELQSLFEPQVPVSSRPTSTSKPAKPRVWVLQRNIEPLLYEGRKFHLRALLLCVGDLTAHLHEDVRVLLATEPFAAGRLDGKNTYAHVTNMGASRAHPSYAEDHQNLSLSGALGQERAAAIFTEATLVLGRTLTNIRAAGRRNFFTTPNCWELFGVDLLVEASTCRAVLLEINPSPSLAMYGSSNDVRTRLIGGDPLSDNVLPSAWQPVPLDATT